MKEGIKPENNKNPQTPKIKISFKGRLMPNILRGSQAHNKKVLEERAKAGVMTLNNPQTENKPKVDRKESVEALSAPNPKVYAPFRELAVKQKVAGEKRKEPEPKNPPLSPFSKAKKDAENVGFHVGEECRGMYETEEIYQRIEVIKAYNKNKKPKKK